MKIKDILPENRPLERLEKKGVESLSDAELLAIILKTGTKKVNVVDLSNQILSDFPIANIENVELCELRKIKGIGKVKACQIKSLYELHKRFSKKSFKDSFKIYSPSQIYDYIKYDIENKEQEHLIAVYLKGNKVISKRIISIGTDNQTLISNKNIISFAIKENAQAIIIAHNHPSGENKPSREDIFATQKLEKVSKDLDIQLLDHLIITKEKYYSFKENGLL